MSDQQEGSLSQGVAAVLREFINALAKAAMYPPGHQLSIRTATQFADRLAEVLETRGTLTFGFTPKALLVDGSAIEPLPTHFRQFAQRMHRRNVGTIQFSPGIPVDELATMLRALASPDAAETVGRDGLRLPHSRAEPLVYEVLAFGDTGSGEQDFDEVFWSRLVEAAFGYRLAEGTPVPTASQLAAAINERATESPEGARRVFEALAAFASALAARGERSVGTARRRFVEVLTALSRPATTRVMAAAPTRVQRRRFMRETLEQVPPTLLLQLLEAVAEADGEPISSHLRWLLGKLAGTEGSNQATPDGSFATEVMGLIEQWDGIADDIGYRDDPRLAAEHSRTLHLGLEVGVASEAVIAAAERLAGHGHLFEVLQAIDAPGNYAEVTRTIAAAVLDTEVLEKLLSDPSPDWALVERVVHHIGTGAVGPLLDGLDSAQDRTWRRRMLDLLVSIGPRGEPELLSRLETAEWHLARNILTVLGHYPEMSAPSQALPRLRDPEPRVRLEALKVLLRSPSTRRTAVTEALESGEPPLVRTALASLGGNCPPELVAPVLGVLMMPDEDAQMQAIRLIGDSDNPLVVGPLLDLVRERRGFLRRWKLRNKSPVMLSALGSLARRWHNHRPVLPVIQMAARSNDDEIRRTVGVMR